jgi:hypothetical protein
MASEPNSPTTTNIAFFTMASLILILVSCIALEGLYYIWEDQAAEVAGEGNLPTSLQLYRTEQAERLQTINDSKAAALKEAQVGKSLAIVVPTSPAKTPEKKEQTPPKQ